MKPMFRKNYGSIGHLPGSRLGAGDHHIAEGQASILTEKTRDYKDLVIVQEKLDGANVGVYREQGRLIALTRAGYRAIDSNLEQFQMFERWLRTHEDWFDFLEEGERLVGEWIAMAHGTRYDTQTPFIAFDLMREDIRMTYIEFCKRVAYRIPIAKLLHIGGALSTKKVDKLLDVRDGEWYGHHGALERVEGAVYRVEREGYVDFLGKYVRQFKQDGKYFNEDKSQLIWNWRDDD